MGPKIDQHELQTILSRVFTTIPNCTKIAAFSGASAMGRKPALINIDLANAWTQPGNPFTCAGMETIIPAVQQLLAGIPCAQSAGRLHDHGL